MLELRYDITRDDYVRWLTWFSAAQVTRRGRLLRPAALVCLVVAIVYLAKLSRIGPSGLLVVAVALVGLWYCLDGFRRLSRWSLSRHVASPAFTSPNGPHQLSVTATSVTETTASGSSTIAWSAVTSVAADGDRIYVQGGGVAIIISRRGYEAKVAFDVLPTLLESMRREATAVASPAPA